MPMLIIFFVTRKWSEGEDFHIFWKSHKKQKEGFTVSLENSFLEKPKETKGDKIKLSNWHPAAFLGLGNFIWKQCLHHWCTRVVLLNLTSLHKPHCPFSMLQTIIQSRQHADYELLKKAFKNSGKNLAFLSISSCFCLVFNIYLFATSKLKSAVLLNYVSKGSNRSNVF